VCSTKGRERKRLSVTERGHGLDGDELAYNGYALGRDIKFTQARSEALATAFEAWRLHPELHV
jgi:hypothetical protein